MLMFIMRMVLEIFGLKTLDSNLLIGMNNFIFDPETCLCSNELSFAIWDKFPVSRGHFLVIPKRHVQDWFEATPEEQNSLFELVSRVKKDIDRVFRPDGYNIGINIGKDAGQTVFHLHVHVIPRYRGDVQDPRGGVRNVIPEKGNYLK